jgi:hypothetical protein
MRIEGQAAIKSGSRRKPVEGAGEHRKVPRNHI